MDKILSLKLQRGAAIIGNIAEYYDHSLYGYMAPFIAPLFFPTNDPLTGLIITYALIPIGFLLRPLGAYLIGKIGDQAGRKTALIISISGMGIVTALIGLLPTYEQWGYFAPLLLTLCRCIQSFFVGAEYNGGAIYTLEHGPIQKHGIMSGIYSAATVIGIFFAAFVSWVVSYYPGLTWRFPFFLGFLATIIGFLLRLFLPEESSTLIIKKISFRTLLKKYNKTLWALILVAGSYNALFTIPSLFLNSYIPLVSNLSLDKVMLANNITLFLYMISLIFFGALSDRYAAKNIMTYAAIMLIVFSYPLFCCLSNATFITAVSIKGALVINGAAFNGSFHAWSFKLFEKQYRYRGISLGYSIGSQLLGATTAAICLWIWQKTQIVAAPAFYLMFCCSMGLIGLKIQQSIHK